MSGTGIETFSVSSHLIRSEPTKRLDASYYSRGFIRALAALDASGLPTVPLGEIVQRVFMPGRFKRTFVSAAYGVPFLQGSHVAHLQPADVKYLSRAAHKNLAAYLIREGWILVTRSGTTGRVALVPQEWDGWAATEDILRIAPSDKCPVGYLASFLGSRVGQAQLSAQVFGAVVDHLTEDQLRAVRVPLPRTAAQRRKMHEIDDAALEALELRSEAVAHTDRAGERLAALVPYETGGEGKPATFAISSDLVKGAAASRLDASFFNPAVLAALSALAQSGMEIVSLADVVERLFIPPRFKRIYVDAEHGVPFLQGSHVPQAQLTDLRYLSRTAHKDLSRWIIRAGWILVTCSGSVGRVTVALPEWDGWAASQHILRIVPNRTVLPPGYLATFLASPLGRLQFTAQIYGAVVDELTEEQARRVRVPIPRTKAQVRAVGEIDKLASDAQRIRSAASVSAERAARLLATLVPEEAPAQTGVGLAATGS